MYSAIYLGKSSGAFFCLEIMCGCLCSKADGMDGEMESFERQKSQHMVKWLLSYKY